jgi:hypothetical protein
MNPTIIRFPTAAKLGEPVGVPMAKPASLGTRLKRWLFGPQRKRTWNSVLFDHARRSRI